MAVAPVSTHKNSGGYVVPYIRIVLIFPCNNTLYHTYFQTITFKIFLIVKIFVTYVPIIKTHFDIYQSCFFKCYISYMFFIFIF